MHKRSTRRAPQPQRLRLAAHVRACEIDGQVILLDLRTNRYVGVGDPTSSTLATCVKGWPACISSDAPCVSQPSVAPGREEPIQALISQGLLTDVSTDARAESIISPAIDEPTASLDLGDIATRPPVGGRRFTSFLMSAAGAAWRLRSRSLLSITEAVSRRPGRQAESSTSELARMKECAVAYERLRPILLTARDKCLFDSLALLGFLAAEDLFPRWVIGVKTGPFGAHSWVQAGATVLNDQHEHVRRFHPILVV